MAFIEPMHRNKPNITYLLTHPHYWVCDYLSMLRLKLIFVIKKCSRRFFYMKYRHINICIFSALTLHRQLKSVIIMTAKLKDSLTLHNQYHECQWSGDARSQGIMEQCCTVDLVLQEYPGLNPTKGWFYLPSCVISFFIFLKSYFSFTKLLILWTKFTLFISILDAKYFC